MHDVARRPDSTFALPEPPIPVAGFPVCRTPHCHYEVAEKGQACTLHGGPTPSMAILRRTFIRKVRTAVEKILTCPDCAGTDPREIRCRRCAVYRGQAIGIAQVAEQCGWETDTNPLLASICPTWESVGLGEFGVAVSSRPGDEDGRTE